MSNFLSSQLAELNQGDWTGILKTPVTAREAVAAGDQSHYKQVAGVFLGVHPDKDEYLEFLYDLAHDPSLQIVLLSEQLDKQIETERFQAIQRILLILQNEKLSMNRFIAFMEGERLIPSFQDGEKSRKIREVFRQVVELFSESHPDGLQDHDFRRVAVDLVKWMWNHAGVWMEQGDYRSSAPKILWYGEASKSEAYFLYFLILLEFDVLIFNPAGKNDLEAVDQAKMVPVLQLGAGVPGLDTFPASRPVRRATVAFKASQEMDRVLHGDDSMLYKPWQFRNYAPSALTLKTTYDELFLLIKERAFIRPNFEVRNERVYIPNIFAKVSGITRNRREYWDRVEGLSEYDLALTIRSYPFSREVRANNIFHYQNALGSDGALDPEKMIEASWWRHKQLPSGLQQGIAHAISRYSGQPRLKQLPHEDHHTLQLYLFNQAMDIPLDAIRLLQKFDYSQEVPRIVIFKSGQNGSNMTRSDAALLLLLNEIGIDIVILNPTGQNDIEMYIDEEFYDTHWLDEVSFEQELREPSIIKKFLKKFSNKGN
ncbi:YceG family protein [Peribacillus kribbensis]|uniref:YceG family protein n=1 Tax=Peribacillus kribbensis TaxID=356658 RepID=UPI0004293D75|nr:YceG family protein [Peribacillus kribbensis]